MRSKSLMLLWNFFYLSLPQRNTLLRDYISSNIAFKKHNLWDVCVYGTQLLMSLEIALIDFMEGTTHQRNLGMFSWRTLDIHNMYNSGVRNISCSSFSLKSEHGLQSVAVEERQTGWLPLGEIWGVQHHEPLLTCTNCSIKPGANGAWHDAWLL